AHATAEDPTRYRDGAEVDAWLGRDPVTRLETYLRGAGALDDETVDDVRAEAERAATDLRTRMSAEPRLDPLSLFDHVYAQPTPQLLEQREQVAAELEAGGGGGGAGGGAAP